MALTLNNNLGSLKVGDYFYSKYTALTSNSVGTFSDIATKTDADVGTLIPSSSSATPDGYFKYIVVDFDHLGRAVCIADRNIQHSISWDTLNSEGIASGSGLSITFANQDPQILAFTTRLLTGGISSTDTDNEWDKYIVNSTLGGTIVAGDDNVWNWNQTTLTSWASTTPSTSVDVASTRVFRGTNGSGTSVSAWGRNSSGLTASTAGIKFSFRSVLLIETLIANKTFIQFNGAYQKWMDAWQAISSTLPTKDIFINDGMDNLDVLDRKPKIFIQDMPTDGVAVGNGLVYKSTVDLNKYFDIIKMEVK